MIGIEGNTASAASASPTSAPQEAELTPPPKIKKSVALTNELYAAAQSDQKTTHGDWPLPTDLS